MEKYTSYNKKQILIVIMVIIFIIIIYCIVNKLFVILNKNTFENNVAENYIETERYISNNPYNSNFSSYDIKNAEEAFYTKYISKIAQENLSNQKIKVKIKSIEKLDEIDKSSATHTKNRIYFFT